MPAQPTLCRRRIGISAPRRTATPHRLQGAIGRRLAALTALVGCMLGMAPALAVPAPDEPTGCSLLWQVHTTTPADGAARQLQVDMAFDAGPRSRTVLRLPGGWAGLQETTTPDTAGHDTPQPGARRPGLLQAVPGAPLLRAVTHAPGERVRLHWRYTGPTDATQGGSVRLAPTWFALAGLGVLPVPEEIDDRNPPSACIQLDGDASGDGRGDGATPTRWASSHGQVDGPTALFRLAAGASPLHHRVQQALYAGGALDRFQSTTNGLPLALVRPSAAGWLATLDSQGQAAVQAWAAQRQFWADSSGAAPLLLLLLPGDSPATGGTWHQALALQAPADLPWPGADADTLLAGALVSTWVPDRFGPLVHAGRNDEALRAWFSDGLAAHFSHRLLLRSGRWSADDYARVMNQRLALLAAVPASQATAPGNAAATAASLAGARGELLALQWHGALRAAGQPGLDAVLQRLLLAPALARHEGPISAPLATHRLVAALRPVLGDAPLRDIQRQAERGEPADLGPTSLGPCFSGKMVTTAGDAAAGDATAGAAAGLAAAGGTAALLMQYQPLPQALQQADCQGWLGLGPQALLARGVDAGSRMHAGKAAAPPVPGQSTRRAGKSSGPNKGKSLHRRSGKPGAKAAGQRQRAGKASTSGKPAKVAAGAKRRRPQ